MIEVAQLAVLLVIAGLLVRLQPQRIVLPESEPDDTEPAIVRSTKKSAAFRRATRG